MTKILEQAVKRAQSLPDSEQDAIGSLIIEELEDEAKWEKKFLSSQKALEKLAAEAMKEDRKGEAKDLNPDLLSQL
ncbi:MAG: hypothetical protein MAG551_01388 [Candidatus Scalindua arabica]|uniref:Uncharacterized protein n=1 Tax=Candidatus Scalindua arabica TaxID=1127984 RepID=A0A942A0U0_9BACT|nr:hypothetical protein [Candidatus Scalindua arabica]